MNEEYLRDTEGKVVLDEEGFPVPFECGPHYGQVRVSESPPPIRRPPVTRTRTPVTSRFRKIGNPSPGVLGDIQTWWAGIQKEWRWGILGGIGVIGVIVAAVQGKGKGKGSSVRKV